MNSRTASARRTGLVSVPWATVLGKNSRGGERQQNREETHFQYDASVKKGMKVLSNTVEVAVVAEKANLEERA